MATKPESSRLNVLYIMYVLSNYSDEEHPVSATDIKERVDKEFGYLSESGQIISMDTVKRVMDELTNRIFMDGMREDNLNRFGYFIHCVMKQGQKLVTYSDTDGKLSPKKYYYYENHLTTPELLTLKDAVETYSFFSEKDITDLIRKIVRLRPQSFTKYASCGKL